MLCWSQVPHAADDLISNTIAIELQLDKAIQKVSLLSFPDIFSLYDQSFRLMRIFLKHEKNGLHVVILSSCCSMIHVVVRTQIVEATYEILQCDRVTLFIVDPIRNELECRVSKDTTGTICSCVMSINSSILVFISKYHFEFASSHRLVHSDRTRHRWRVRCHRRDLQHQRVL